MTDQQKINVGDIVRVSNPECFFVAFATRIKDRDAEVLWIGPTKFGHAGKAGVRFLKRNGRGKEFTEVLYVKELIKKEDMP